MLAGIGLLMMGRVKLACLLFLLIPPLSSFFSISSSDLPFAFSASTHSYFCFLISSGSFSFLDTVLILQNTKGGVL